ncbi:CASP C terminal-domain-containing protein [Mycotypha africana]|uniref:CASP C terminal-domain-containing protein n=1 Tax=Mycotypha africana TaxID=64632 RepID=UPI002301503A|nr:CASP C terminal-domain-containing protein [Mycotypha africana]KAI8968413.1 CASP C terminal-domain-containing protein [Mycotypha africana]
MEDSFGSAIQYWRGIQLVNLQKELDQQGLTIVENQKDGLVSRKKLAEQTREFKKMPDEEKIQKFKPLLKGYQSEIDSITKRTKFAENAFLTIYKLLADAPDPAPLFEAAIDQSAQMVDISALQNENSLLKEELEKRNKKLEILEKDNKDLTQKISQLEEKVADNQPKGISKLEQEMRDQYSDKIKQNKEREYDLQKKLNQALDQLAELRQSHEDTQAQLIGHDQKYDEEVVGKLAELDIVTMDLERANGRIIQLEKHNDDLKEENKKLRDGTTESLLIQSQIIVRNDHAQNVMETTKLIKDIEAYKEMLNKTELRLNKKIKDLTAETEALMEERDTLKKSLKKFEDYDDIKRELHIMKYVEFSTGEDEDDFQADDVLKDESIVNSLEVQLMEKIKKLESEYTQIKVLYSDLKKSSDEKTQKLEALEKQIDEKIQLNQRLEEDLLRMGQQKAVANSGDISVSENSTGRYSISDPRTSVEVSGSMTPRTADALSGGKEDKTILPIVMSQRDRFRQRNAELEERTRSLESTVQDLQTEIQNLRTDNLKLYERLKFVHVWKEGQQQNNTGITVSTTIYHKQPSLQADDPSVKYGKLYEESMNPFTQFHRKEENRRYNALNPFEKLTLNLTRILFSHKWSRYFFIFYSLLLHFLVIMTLYQLSLWECRHDHEDINFPTNLLNEEAAISNDNFGNLI